MQGELSTESVSSTGQAEELTGSVENAKLGGGAAPVVDEIVLSWGTQSHDICDETWESKSALLVGLALWEGAS